MSKSIVYNRDCLEAMREMPDKAFDLAIVDPPYGIKRFEQTTETDGRFNLAKSGIWNTAPPPEYFTELRRVSQNQIIWGANYLDETFNGGRIIWNKLGTDTTRRKQAATVSDAEIAYQSFHSLVKMFSYAWIGNVRGNDYQVQWDGQALHPCEKPIALYRWCLANYAKPGDTILDTHLGSGSSRIAAYDLGFDFVGFELDIDYFNAQEERFVRHVAQGHLFLPPEPMVEQQSLI